MFNWVIKLNLKRLNVYWVRLIFPLYRAFFIVPKHRAVKRKTKKYWDEFDAACKSQDKARIDKAAISLNQALQEFFPQ